jgi:peptidyl-prolyl cis-trans isomerase B (cyclophilin B)
MMRAWRTWVVVSLAIVLLTTATGCGKETDAKPANGTTASPTASTTPSPTASTTPAANGMANSGDSAAIVDALSKQFPGLPLMTGKATLQLTVQGQPVTIEIDGANAPVTAGNFIDLVEKKFYDGLVFHRVVKEPSPFVAQGGDPAGKDPNVPVDQLGTGGYIDPKTNQERRIPLEIKPKDGKTVYGGTFSMVPELAGKKPLLKHTRGAVAMARSMQPNSASSQFYITLADQAFLDGEYAVFGYVKQGMEAVDKINQGDRIESIRVLQMDQGAFRPGQ